MQHRAFGNTGWEVSVIGLGCWNLGNQWGAMSDGDAARIVHAALDSGINLLDLAESYGTPNGTSELRVGRALLGRRGDVRLVSKIGHWGLRTGQAVPKTTPDMIRLCGHACCGRLRTDHIDLMLCHEGDIRDPAVYVAGFEQLRQEGFIGAYGISTNDLEAVQRFHAASGGHCVAVECDYSLLNTDPERGLLPWCQTNGVAVLARGPLAMGLLSGRYTKDTVFTDEVRAKWNWGQPGRADYERRLAQLARLRAAAGADADLPALALRYVVAHPAAPVAIPGATSPGQVQANVQAVATSLSAAEHAPGLDHGKAHTNLLAYDRISGEGLERTHRAI